MNKTIAKMAKIIENAGESINPEIKEKLLKGLADIDKERLSARSMYKKMHPSDSSYYYFGENAPAFSY